MCFKKARYGLFTVFTGYREQPQTRGHTRGSAWQRVLLMESDSGQTLCNTMKGLTGLFDNAPCRRKAETDMWLYAIEVFKHDSTIFTESISATVCKNKIMHTANLCREIKDIHAAMRVRSFKHDKAIHTANVTKTNPLLIQYLSHSAHWCRLGRTRML